MKLRTPLTALALLVGLPTFVPQANAWDIQPNIGIAVGKDAGRERIQRIVFSVPDGSGTAAATAEVESDAGNEELRLVETDAWLHGAATIAALPAGDATLSLTLYDNASAALMSFSGTVGADGSVSLVADATREKVRDIEVLAAELFTASKGYDVALDLAGADTYSVAYATITVTEPGASVCLAVDEKGNCLKWDTTKEVSTRTEVYWDDIGSVWEADTTLEHEGLVEVKVKSYDAKGKKLEATKSKLGAPFLDDGEGVNTLATDEDPLTRVAVDGWSNHSWGLAVDMAYGLVVVSEGWSAADALPIDAEVELTNGATIRIPANSYQRPGHSPTQSEAEILFKLLDTAGRIVIDDGEGGDVTFDIESLEELSVPLCSEGFCVLASLTGRGTYALSVSAYGPVASDLPDRAEVEITAVDAAGEPVSSEWVTVDFDEEITAVFANELAFKGDPTNLGLSGKVKLLGEANRKGKQETLAKGKFSGAFSRDGGGGLELAGADKDTVVSSGGNVVGGKAASLTDREGAANVPPVVVTTFLPASGRVGTRCAKAWAKAER